jgi:hypothetical protein
MLPSFLHEDQKMDGPSVHGAYYAPLTPRYTMRKRDAARWMAGGEEDARIGQEVESFQRF